MICLIPVHGTLEWWSLTFLAPVTPFAEDSFSTDQRVGGGWFRDDSNVLHSLCNLFLLFLHHFYYYFISILISIIIASAPPQIIGH